MTQQLAYSQRQAAKLAHMGQDFIARKIREGELYARIDLGSTGKKMIHIPHDALMAFLNGKEYRP